jgi:hypothetical protein
LASMFQKIQTVNHFNKTRDAYTAPQQKAKELGLDHWDSAGRALNKLTLVFSMVKKRISLDSFTDLCSASALLQKRVAGQFAVKCKTDFFCWTKKLIREDYGIDNHVLLPYKVAVEKQ